MTQNKNYIPPVITIRQQLQGSSSIESAKQIFDLVHARPELMSELVEVYLEGPLRLTQRAAGVICMIAKKNPSAVIPALPVMVNKIKEPGIADADKRNTLRILQLTGIPKALEEDVMELSFGYLESRKEAVAIKAFSMTLLHQLTDRYPDLRNELCLLIEDQLSYQKPAFVSRGRKILAQLKK